MENFQLFTANAFRWYGYSEMPRQLLLLLPEAILHSVLLLCDELTVEEKELFVKCICSTCPPQFQMAMYFI